MQQRRVKSQEQYKTKEFSEDTTLIKATSTLNLTLKYNTIALSKLKKKNGTKISFKFRNPAIQTEEN